MFDLIAGIPIHALVVHGVVVLLPLAVLGAIAIAIRPAWQQRFGTLVLGLSVLATALVPVAGQSGESLQARVGDPGEHAELGDRLIFFALAFLVPTAALVLRKRFPVLNRIDSRIISAVVILAGLLCLVQVFLVGHSGAEAVWLDRVAS
jgi:uncharacterized membrane protein